MTAPTSGEYDYVVITVEMPVGWTVKLHGINASGQAVGEAIDGSAVRRACLWLPADAYGLDSGLNILDDSYSGFQESVAFDINDEGVIVGQLKASNNAFPYVWDLSGSYTSGPIYDNQNPPQLLLLRAALDINNDAEPKIVGGAAPNNENPTTAFAATQGFYHNLDTGSTTILTPSGGGAYAVALGIADTHATLGLRYAGFASCSGISCPGGNCEWQVDGNFWGTASPASGELKEIDDCELDTARTIGYAVNNSLWVVGMGDDPTDLDVANRRVGLVWSGGPENAPIKLPLLDESEQEPQDESTAFDIRGTIGSTPMEIVGKSYWGNVGVLWRWNASSWDTPINLHIASCTVGNASVPTTTGINASGWICGYGTYSTEIRGWVLIPVDDYRNNWCAHDISGPGGECPNGVVDIYDLFTLLANWNTDGPGADFASPTNIVNVSDLFQLLAVGSWACGIGGRGADVDSLEDEVTEAGLTMDDWDDFEYVMQYSESETEKSNYKCWMMNYLSGCSVCPPCVGDDPYDPRE